MESKINYIIREVPPEGNDLSWAFEDDGLTEAGGDWNYNLFVVADEGWGRIYGFNIETYKRVLKQAENLRDDFALTEEYIANGDRDAYGNRPSYKSVMEDYRIPYNPLKCHALKEWAKDFDRRGADDIAAYLTITTGKKWNRIGVCGNCQGDYVDVVYCEGFHENPKYYGECWLGCAREYGVIEVENYEADEDGDPCYDEVDSCYGYIVSDSQAWREADVKRLVCEWAGIPEDETVLELIESVSHHTTYHYRTV